MKQSIGVLVLSMVVVSVIVGQETKFYSVIDNDVLGGIVGIHEVSETDLATRKGYRLDYIDDHLSRVTFVDHLYKYGAASSFFGCSITDFKWTDARTVLVAFKDKDGNSVDSGSGVFFERDIYDDSHRLAEAYLYDASMKMTVDGRGVGYKTYTYPNGANFRITELYDLSGERTSEPSRVHTWKTYFNENHRKIASFPYDINNEPVVFDDGTGGTSYTYDDSGNLIEEERLSFNGRDEPIRLSDSDGISIKKYEYNSSGDIVDIKYLSKNEKKKTNKDGVYETIIEVDGDGFVLSVKTNGLDGLPCEVDGVFEFRYVLDDRKNPIDERRFDRNGEQIVELRSSFDTQDRTTLFEVLGKDGKLQDAGYPGTDVLYARAIFTYDQNGNVTKRYFDKIGSETFPEVKK